MRFFNRICCLGTKIKLQKCKTNLGEVNFFIKGLLAKLFIVNFVTR